MIIGEIDLEGNVYQTMLESDESNHRDGFAGLRNKIDLHMSEAPQLRNPVLVAGLPDSGRVAKIVLDHLVKSLKASRLGHLYSDYLPPRLLIDEVGTIE